jgi:predicted nucleic acid-binding protein
MFYLVVARRNGAVLITKDQKLIKLAKEMQIEVIENKS